MPRPKRTKIGATAAKKDLTNTTSTKRQQRSSLKPQHALQNAHSQLSPEADQPQSSNDALPASTSSSSRPRRALADISHQVQSPNVRPINAWSPWADQKKASMPLEDGFEEYLQSSSPRLPPTTISRPPSATKAQATPSFLSVAKFRQRPRQPSILRMVQQDAQNDQDTTDITGDDLTLGNLGNSSPIPFDNSPDQPVEQALPSSGTKRKAFSLEPETEIISIHEDEPDPVELPEQVASDHPTSPDQLPLALTNNPPFKKTPPPRRRRMIKPKQSSLPKQPSSSPPNSASSPHPTPPANDTSQAKLSAQSQQPQRVSKRRKTNKSSENTQTAPTASLKELLPKPRTRLATLRKRDTFDIGSSSDNEVSFHEEETEQAVQDRSFDSDLEQNHRNQARLGRKGRKKTNSAREKPGLQNSARTNAASKTQPQARSSKRKTSLRSKSKSTTKTYGRQSEMTEIDKENCEESSFFDEEADEDDEDNTVPVESSEDADGAAVKATLGKSKELAAAKKKFEEVDDWELSFESCDVGDQSSSPWR